jgi:hypothetical protein
VDEQRRASRFEQSPDEVYAAVWIDGEEAILAEVHDESLGGIGLLLDIGCGIGLGSVINIVFAGSHYVAQVRHVKPWDHDRVLVGFHCDAVPVA